MEEADELKAKAMASNSKNVNPGKDVEASKTREEGELSDSYDDENLGCSPAQSGGIVVPPLGPNPTPLAVKSTPPNLAGNTDTGNNLASTVDIPSQQSVPPKSQKNIEKSQLAFKSSNRSWYAPSGGSNNLVIRFSDDDSGSDSEECSQQKTVERKSNSTSDGTRKLLSSSAPKLNKFGQTSGNITKVIQKKPLSRTFISSMTKINGGANSRVAGPSSLDQVSRVKYFNPRNKVLASQDLGSNSGVGSNNSKLQDLRQQIALRESELKLKVAQLNKETVSAATMNVDNGSGRKWTPTSQDAGLTVPKEPDKKRLKISDVQKDVHPVKSNLVSKDLELETNSLQNRDKIDQSKKVVPASKAKSCFKWQKKDDKQVDISSENTSKVVKDGVNTHRDLHQSKRTSKQVDRSVLPDQTASLTNISPSALPNNLSNVELNLPTKVSLHNPPSSSLIKATREQNLSKGSDYREITSGDKILEPCFSRKCQTSQNTANLWNCLGGVNNSGRHNVDIHSLVEIEEKLDKELEEAQQHRRMCEIEERNALKAYRKAQRALIEANARCQDLYRQRELCSARFRSFIVDDSSLLWSSRQHEHTGIGLDTSNDVLGNMDPVPMSSHRLQPEYDGFGLQGDPNVQHINVATDNQYLQHENGQNLGSEPCSEPDASTSEPFHHNSNNAANAVRSPCSPIMSADEDEETSPMGHDSLQSNPDYQQKKQKSEVIQRNADNESNNQDSLLLEATLRSELFERLGIKNSSKNTESCYDGEPIIERGAENDVESEKTQLSNGSLTQSEAERKHQFDVSGPEKLKEVTSAAPVPNKNQHLEKENASKFIFSANPEDNVFSIGCHSSAPSIISLPSSILRSVIGHMKVMTPVSRERENNFYSEEGAYVNFDEFDLSGPIGNSLEEVVLGSSGKEMGSYVCTIAVDPFWPLCMYELRGKCNNDECPFQHVKDISRSDMYQNVQDGSDIADCQLGLTTYQQRSNGPTSPSKCHDFSFSPTYIVSLDILKADPHADQSVLTWKNAHCWRKCFSVCLTLPNFLQKDHLTDEPLLDGDDGRIEVRGSWNRQSSYFQSRNGIANKLNKALGMNAQSLEMALLIINQEVDKLEGMKKALALLSRALEADPASETLWMVYLIIYYSRMTFSGKDDMSSYAVRNNDGSYELWLMYINSRKQLDDRLVAYDAALSALSRGESSSEKDEMHRSACILDLFLQMMDCLCISGDVEKAIQTVHRILPATTNSDGPHSPTFTDILTCLTISDKCVLWVSCIYLVIYRKLPDAVLRRLEREKELLQVEWPSVHLGNDEKKRVVQWLDMVTSCANTHINGESFKSEDDLRSAQLFALNHIRCMVALDGSGCRQSLLEKYIKLYPSCLELVLLSARERKDDSGNLSFVGFEEALDNWPKEAPGIQCIWNQYVEYAQQNGNPDLVRKLMSRWYHSVWEVKYPERENLNAINGGNSFDHLERGSTSKPELLVANNAQMDVMFGYLNLFLCKFLESDHVEARSAIDLALRAASTMGFNHCVKEHAAFLLSDESQKKGGVPISWQLNTLKIYLDTAQSLSISEPLSRRFISKIEKSRVQQLVRNILSPVSSDSSLVNLVLEVWYGPTLLPQNLTEPKSLVDFVEAILGIEPSNYELVFSLLKMLTKGDSYINVSPSLLFWASSTLVNAILQGVPVPPEYVWVKAANILDNIQGTEAMLKRLYKKALSVYPFSLKLWQCYQNLTKKIKGDGSIIAAAARERGIELD